MTPLRVNVIVTRPSQDRILSRLARYLEMPGWTLSQSPDPKADVTYFLPYLETSRHKNFTATPLAAFFTHRDSGNPGKAKMWDDAARQVDLCIPMSERYVPELVKPRNVRVIHAPVDPQFFSTTLRDRRPWSPAVDRVVGVSGWVYADGRKGETLYTRLRQNLPRLMGQGVQFKSTGDGWDRTTHTVPWSDLPAFYQSLDVFVCTSLVEGGPMPPLEALAVGIPIVVPIGVGIIDELADAPGIYRYYPGDYDALETAVQRALLQESIPVASELRSVVADFTVANWQRDHIAAFEELLGRKPSVPNVNVEQEVPKPEKVKRGRKGRNATTVSAPAAEGDCSATTPPGEDFATGGIVKGPFKPLRLSGGSVSYERQPDQFGYVVPDLGTTVPVGPSILSTQSYIVHTDAGAVGVSMPDQRIDRGIYVVAYGGPARECAVRLFRSIRQYMPDTPIALAGDAPLNEGETVFIKAPDEDIGARSVKTRIYDLAPAEWQQVLYLDADTELVAPVDFLLDSVTPTEETPGWDFTICKNPQRFHLAKYMVRPDNREECQEVFDLWGSDQMFQLNGGVFAFQRNATVEAFFRTWHAEWLRYGKRDQGALLRALWANPMRLNVLGNEWNLVPTYDPVSRSAGIVHHVTEARRWDGVVTARSDSPEAWAKVRR